MVIYIRHRTTYLYYLTSQEELDHFLTYFHGKEATLGDYAVWSSPLKQRLLKVYEEMPQLNLYSSVDVTDSVLLSRAITTIKDPLDLKLDFSIKDFNESDKSYLSVRQFFDTSPHLQLLASRAPDRIINLLSYLK